MNKLAVLTLVSLLLVPSARPQGGLTPTGPPTPTMKTLDQVEPRTPIAQPASFPIIITQPGSYYLTGNITGAADTDGIRINVGGVTIDLNGFEMVSSGTVGDGIDAPAVINNVTIRNGVIRGWGDLGLNLQNVTNARAESVTVSGCADIGMRCGQNGSINNCIFSANAVGGLFAGT